MSRPTILAILAVRNEAAYLEFLLPHLVSQGIDVALVDHGSIDRTGDIVEGYRDRGVVAVDHLAFEGTFPLAKLLRAKQALMRRLDYDWVVHQDADEVLEGLLPGQTLRHAVEEADGSGFNALNFEEFVFLPGPSQDYCGRNFREEVLRYYFFEPSKRRLNRAWKRGLDISNVETGGHRLSGKAMFPEINHVLRHYIVLSQTHAESKYLGRVYDQEGCKKGWHARRLLINKDNILLPGEHELIRRMSYADDKPLQRDRPTNRHFWEWSIDKD